ncbi:MAG: hypothetical protein FWH05_00695 [Oscillospiraceae bacterium]|nr:hypothetical protein [Oscillospiraceae bacterium]
MKKALSTIIISGFAVLAMSTASFATTGDGVVGGAVRGAGDVVRGAAEGVEEIVNGAANTAEDIVTPGHGNYATKDGTNREGTQRVHNRERQRVAGAASERNPATGVSAIPFAMTLGSIGVATMAAASGRRR